MTARHKVVEGFARKAKKPWLSGCLTPAPLMALLLLAAVSGPTATGLAAHTSDGLDLYGLARFASARGERLLPVDAKLLDQTADMFHIPHVVMWAVAWSESRLGERGNDYLGPGKVVYRDITYHEKYHVTRIMYHVEVRICREIGRMQVNPCLWHVPPKLLKDYRNNLMIGASILAACHKKAPWADAIKCYNGQGGDGSYVTHASEYIGKLTLLGLDSKRRVT